MAKAKKIKILPALVCLTIFSIIGCKSQIKVKKGKADKSEYIKTGSGLKFRVLKEGSGEVAEIGDEALIFETTSYRDGTKLYSNENSANPIKVKIGAGMVTDGVDEGLQGMRTGEIRQLVVPHYLAKRKFYPDNISPDSTLVIKLVLDEVIKVN